MHTTAACAYFWYSFDNVLLICLFWPYVLNSLAKTFLESKFSRLFKTSGFLKLVVLQIFFSIFWLRVCKLLCVESCMCCLCLMFVIVISGQKRNFINLQDWFLVQSWALIKFLFCPGITMTNTKHMQHTQLSTQNDFETRSQKMLKKISRTNNYRKQNVLNNLSILFSKNILTSQFNT